MSRFLWTSPLGSQRAEEGHGTPSDIHDYSLDILESGCSASGNETRMELNSSFYVKQGPSDAPMAAEEHTLGWPQPCVNAPFVSRGAACAVPFPSWETEGSITPSRDSAMLAQADAGSSSISYDTGSQMIAGDMDQREIIGNSTGTSFKGAEMRSRNTEDAMKNLSVDPLENGILNRFEAIRRARDSHNCTGTQPLGDRDHMNSIQDTHTRMIDTEGIYPSGDQTLCMSMHGSENYGNVSISGSRASSKRKICAIGNSTAGSSSKVSAYTCSYSGTSDPVMLGMASDDRHGRNGQVSTCLNSIKGESSESMVMAIDGSGVHQVGAHVQQGEWFLNDNSRSHGETIRDPLLRPSTSADSERRPCPETADGGCFSIAAEQAVSNLQDPSQVRQRASYSQPDLRISRRVHHEPRRSLYPSHVDFTGYVPSLAPSSESHGSRSFTNLSSTRENGSRQTESHLDLHAYGGRSHQNPISASRGRHSRLTTSNRFPSTYDAIRPEVLNRTNSSRSDPSEMFSLADPPFHTFAATSISSAPGIPEYSTRLRSRTPPAHNRHPTSFVSATPFPNPVFSSATLEPPSTQSRSTAPPPADRAQSTSRVLRRLMLSRQSLLDALGERSLLSAAGNVIAFPLHRLGALRIGEDQQHHQINDAINEQMLMLEATLLFGGIGIQDEHSDWRLDVDNMSYEELLALGEQIGDVCTGLSEEVISEKLKTWTYVLPDDITISTLQETEVKCCVCQEEYQEGEELGGLVCGHSYHTVCIKQWLVQKNLCPVCKAAAFS